jgi:hypothetical protein
MLVVLFLVQSAYAQAPAPASACDPTEAAALRAHLASEADSANTWNWAWRIVFTGAAVGTLAVGLADPFPSLRHGFYGSAGKATIGATARWFLPLRIHVPDANADACEDVKALRRELERVARKERNLFWMGHIGGILVNLGGAAYVWYEDDLGKALLSIAVGYPVGVLSNYTMPRGTWKKWRQTHVTWTAGVVPSRDGWMLSAAGTF